MFGSLYVYILHLLYIYSYIRQIDYGHVVMDLYLDMFKNETLVNIGKMRKSEKSQYLLQNNQ